MVITQVILPMMCYLPPIILGKLLLDVQHLNAREFLYANMLQKQFLSLILMDDRRLEEEARGYLCLPGSLLRWVEALVWTKESLRVCSQNVYKVFLTAFSFYNSTLERWQLGKHCKRLRGPPCHGTPVVICNQNAVSTIQNTINIITKRLIDISTRTKLVYSMQWDYWVWWSVRPWPFCNTSALKHQHWVSQDTISKWVQSTVRRVFPNISSSE